MSVAKEHRFAGVSECGPLEGVDLVSYEGESQGTMGIA